MKRTRGIQRKTLIIVGSMVLATALLGSCASLKYPLDYGFEQKTSYKGHTDQVLDLDLSPDGAYLASASADDTVRVWDTDTMSQMLVLEGHADDVYAVEFGSSGRKVVTACRDGKVRLYGGAEGKLITEMVGHSGNVIDVAISPDEKYVASAGEDTTVRLWEAASGELLKVFRGHSSEVNSVVFGPQGKWIYSGGWDGTIRSWNVQDLVPGFVQHVHNRGVVSIAMGSGNSIYFTGVERVRDEGTGERKNTYPFSMAKVTEEGLQDVVTRRGHGKVAWAVEPAPELKAVITGGKDKRMLFWPLAGGSAKKVLPQSGSIWDIAYAHKAGKIFIATTQNEIIAFEK